MVTQEVIKAIAPEARLNNVTEMLKYINPILSKYKLDTPLVVAHFLSQLAHESGGFNRLEENLMYSSEGLMKTFSKYFPNKELADKYARKKELIANRVYANRMENGDEASGDGWKYRGRGYIQLTGRYNYELYGKKIGIDLVTNPDKAMEVKTALELASCYFVTVGCVGAAKNDNCKAVTKLINGGYIGLAHRQALLDRAKKALGI